MTFELVIPQYKSVYHWLLRKSKKSALLNTPFPHILNPSTKHITFHPKTLRQS